MKCEACGEFPQMINLDTRDGVYNICHNCLLKLVTLSLSNQEFKNLLKNGHKSTEFYLHSDFYDGDGNALQSKFGTLFNLWNNDSDERWNEL